MRRWKIKQQNEKQIEALSIALHCSHFLARILYNRGCDTVDKAKAMLNVNRSVIGDPFLFRNMRAVVDRIGEALQNGEKITVYGDYDVDGITATGLLVEVLRELGCYVDFYIPSRFTEGYGVNTAAVKMIAERGTSLVITVDTGITAVKEVEFAKEVGVDFIITDHHECQAELPDTLIINPKQQESGYPYPDLAGVGVVYKLCCALFSRFDTGVDPEKYLPFVAVGTVADIMPMRGENRYIVRRGLEALKKTECIGLRAIIDRCVGERPIDTSAVGFVIAPRINAAGRMGSASVGVDLLTTRDSEEAVRLVNELCRENNHRQEIENKILEDAIRMIEENEEIAQKNAIVLWGNDWHNGVVGIVASRLKDRYGKPCILFSINGDYAKGSGRSVRPFNLFEALGRISDKVERFGGHAFAAGVLVHCDRLEVFRESFCREVDAFLAESSFDEFIEIDCTLRDYDLTLEKIKELRRSAPFGRDNETPVFCIRNAMVLDATPTANGNHMRLILQSGHLRVTGFYFNMSSRNFPYCSGDRVDVVFEADINTYNGRQSVQISIKDLHYAEERCEKAMADIQRIESDDITACDVPERKHTALVYRFLERQIAKGIVSFDIFALQNQMVQFYQGADISTGKIYFSLMILQELGVLAFNKADNLLLNLHINCDKRVRLEDSKVLKAISLKAGDQG